MSYETSLRIGVKTSPEDVYRTLTEPKRLAQWWTSDTRGSGTKIGETLEFWFHHPDYEFCQKFNVKALEPEKQVVWKSPKGQGADEWEGTEVQFDILKDVEQTYVRFLYSGWREDTDFHAHCSMKWATFMLSLKELLEKGKGRPAPNDVQINYS